MENITVLELMGAFHLLAPHVFTQNRLHSSSCSPHWGVHSKREANFSH